GRWTVRSMRPAKSATRRQSSAKGSTSAGASWSSARPRFSRSWRGSPAGTSQPAPTFHVEHRRRRIAVPRGTSVAVLALRLRLVSLGFLVLRRVVRHHDDLAVATFADAHRGDSVDVAERDVHGAAVLLGHPPRVPPSTRLA